MLPALSSCFAVPPPSPGLVVRGARAGKRQGRRRAIVGAGGPAKEAGCDVGRACEGSRAVSGLWLR